MNGLEEISGSRSQHMYWVGWTYRKTTHNDGHCGGVGDDRSGPVEVFGEGDETWVDDGRIERAKESHERDLIHAKYCGE